MYREELTIVDELLVKANRIVIPTDMGHDCLETLHVPYLGLQKTLLRACTSVFWPGMTADIKALISNCSVCQKFQSRQPAETLRNEVPTTQPWTCLATDIFEYGGKSYLIITDQFSKFIVVHKVADHSSEQTVAAILQVFSEFGVPDSVRCNHGTNFTSHLFLSFCKGLDVKLSFSSAYHHSGNPAECAVHIIKNIMRKCAHTNTNWRLGLLEYLCTPLSARLASPAKLLATHWYKGLQPTLCARLLPQSTIAESNKDDLISCKEMEKANHDRSAHDLPILPVGCTVTYFDHMSKAWLVGKIAQRAHDCAYLIESEAGRLVSCNRCDIRRSHLTFVPNLPKLHLNLQSIKDEMSNPGSTPVGDKPSIRQSNASHPTTRCHVSGANCEASSGLVTHSGRVVCKPDRLNL